MSILHKIKSPLEMCRELADSDIARKPDGSKPTYAEFRKYLFNGGIEDIINWYNQMIVIKNRIK